MKYIDFLVKKVLSESLNEKADELTNKIQEKISGEMKEWGSEDDFYEDEFENSDELPDKKEQYSKLKKFLETLRRKNYGDKEDLSNIELEESEEFDYVEEGECNECGNQMGMYEIDEEELDEKLFGDQYKLDHNKNNKIDSEDLRMARSKKREQKEDSEMEEGNAFTEKLKQTPKGGKFKLGGKTYTDTSNIDESIKYSISINNENIILSENEMIDMIEEIVMEEKKGNLKSTGRAKGTVEYDRVHRKDGDINKKANEESFKKMKDYVKAGSKGSFETNPKHFPKGNGQLAKMDKKTYKASDAVEEYIDTFAYGGGMLDLDPDEIGYNEDWLEKTIEGSSMTGNSPEYANAEDTGYGKKLNKRRKENLYNQEKRQTSYNRVKQPVDVAGENTKSGKLNKMFKKLGESEEEQKDILSEEMVRMKQMIGYNKNTQ
jgi:hypothetical protein